MIRNEILYPLVAGADGVALIGTAIQTDRVLSIISAILTCVAFAVSIVLGIIGIVIKVKTYLKDGKIDDKEREDLRNDIHELQQNVSNFAQSFDKKGKEEDKDE